MKTNKIIKAIQEVHEQFKGGSGSGNFGHSGRPGKIGGSAGGGGGAYAGMSISSRPPSDVKKGDKVVAYVDPEDPDFNLPGSLSNIRGDDGNLVKIGTKGTVVEQYDANAFEPAEINVKWDNGQTTNFKWYEYEYGKKLDNVEMDRLNRRLSNRFRLLD